MDNIQRLFSEREVDLTSDNCMDIKTENSWQQNVSNAKNYSSAFRSIPLVQCNKTYTCTQVTGAWSEFNDKNFIKGCKWSPDGTYILTNSEDKRLRVFNLPTEFWTGSFKWDELTEMTPFSKTCESELVYDYCWYPSMRSSIPSTCCFVTTSRDNPVHMWDAFTGQLRCTYRAYNHVDEITAAHCVAFNLTGERLFCGFKKTIRIFDVNFPGRDCDVRSTLVKKQGQLGIISCIAFDPSCKDIYAAGSYSKTIGIYTEPKGELVFMLSGQQGGVTHLIFSPDGTKLYSGGRKDPEILCWDIRNPGTVLFSMRRQVTTNQRIYFDLDRTGRYLVSGNKNGIVTIWDMLKAPKEVINQREPIQEPVYFYRAHNDSVNGVSFNPCLPLLCTSSGERKFDDLTDSDSDCDSVIFTNKNISYDNSLRLWHLNYTEQFEKKNDEKNAFQEDIELEICKSFVEEDYVQIEQNSQQIVNNKVLKEEECQQYENMDLQKEEKNVPNEEIAVQILKKEVPCEEIDIQNPVQEIQSEEINAQNSKNEVLNEEIDVKKEENAGLINSNFSFEILNFL